MENCPKCKSENFKRSGMVKGKQRFRCKDCNYYFTVAKLGRSIDNYYVIKALQLYIEGVSYREIERLLGVSHVSVMNWVKEYNISRPENLTDYKPTYHIFNHTELMEFLKETKNLIGYSLLVTEIGTKVMVIQWERFRNL